MLLAIHVPLPITFSPVLRTVFALLPLAILAYSLDHHLRRLARLEFERTAWDAERARGRLAGHDKDGDGDVDPSERTRESAEWANALIAGVWPILNTDL
jgi:hypothetical protein